VIPRHWSADNERVTAKAPACEHCIPPPNDRSLDDNGKPFLIVAHRDINERLKVLKATAVKVLDNFAREKGRSPSRNELRDELNRSDGKATGEMPMDLLSFVQTFIDSAQGRVHVDGSGPLHYTTLNRYELTFDLLTAYCAKRANRKTPPPVFFAEVDGAFVAGFTQFLTKGVDGKKYAANTVVKYSRTLRKFLRLAKEHREVGKEVNPEVFSKDYTLKEVDSDQIYLNTDELAAFYQLDLSANPRLDRARDLFIVGAWTGLRFGDLSRIQLEHIHDVTVKKEVLHLKNGKEIKEVIERKEKRIRVRTSKTSTDVTIPVHPCIPVIMAKYGGRVPSGISNQKQNGYIKEAAAMVPELQVKTMEGRTTGGVRREVAKCKWERVTTHTARRSFASNFYRDGTPARTIMAITGHRTEQAFMRYIRLSNEEHADIMAKSSLFSMSVMKAV